MRPREWTTEDLDWLTDNYPHKTEAFCANHFQVSIYAVRKKAKELQLKRVFYKRDKQKEKKLFAIKIKSPVYMDAYAKGHCLDCVYYLSEGNCSKTGREVGALWQKKCFRGEG